MTDRIVLHDMVFMGRHGVLEQEQREDQPFHVDVELGLDLRPAGVDDDLSRTVDYGAVFETCRSIVESTRFQLIEALAEAIAHELLADFPLDEVTVRVRKPNAPIDGTFAYAGVEIQRRRSTR
jgi:7,8-dihydroneopterin aldolase/epimerase/oxygenase